MTEPATCREAVLQAMLTATREAGTDIIARQPATRARPWFANGLLSALLLRDAYPQAFIVMAFADAPTYRRLGERTKGLLSQLGMGLWLVDESGSVVEVTTPRPPVPEGGGDR